MNEIVELSGKIKKWKTIDSKKIVTDLLLQVQELKKDETEDNISSLLDTLIAFHKEINKPTNSEIIDEQWFQHVQKAKKNLKKIQEQKKKDKNKPPELIKSSSHIQYPEQLTKDKREQDKVYSRTLYKNFLIHLPQGIIQRKLEIITYIQSIINHLYEEYGIEKQNVWIPEDKSNALKKRVQKINENLQKRQAARAKQDMLDGLIQPQNVAKLNPDAFISEKTKKAEKQRLQAMARQNETGFYDQMKKDINKNASQQCRFCHKPSAYCEGQKQIRAADEPMTRFMVCNLCGKRWRQQ